MRFVGCARMNCCEYKVSRYFRLKFTDDRQILFIYKPIFVYSSTITSSFHSSFMCMLSTRVYSKFLDNIVAVLRPGNSSPTCTCIFVCFMNTFMQKYSQFALLFALFPLLVSLPFLTVLFVREFSSFSILDSPFS